MRTALAVLAVCLLPAAPARAMHGGRMGARGTGLSSGLAVPTIMDSSARGAAAIPDTGRFQIFFSPNGSVAYLLDTQTGRVWTPMAAPEGGPGQWIEMAVERASSQRGAGDSGFGPKRLPALQQK